SLWIPFSKGAGPGRLSMRIGPIDRLRAGPWTNACSLATFMQSAIVQKVSGQTVLDYLRPRLFAPLGIEHPVWDANFQGISLGGYGLRVRTEDIAKFFPGANT